MHVHRRIGTGPRLGAGIPLALLLAFALADAGALKTRSADLLSVLATFSTGTQAVRAAAPAVPTPAPVPAVPAAAPRAAAATATPVPAATAPAAGDERTQF